MGRILGVDYGRKRIGLSLSDQNQKIALPLETLPSGKNPEESAKKLVLFLQSLKEPVEKIIIGYPKKMDGTKSEMTEEVEAFSSFLQAAISISQEFIDERLSSAFSHVSLKEAGLNRKDRSKYADEQSACIILQAFLDKNKL